MIAAAADYFNQSLSGGDWSIFKEFGVGSEAEGFQQLGLHLF